MSYSLRKAYDFISKSAWLFFCVVFFDQRFKATRRAIIIKMTRKASIFLRTFGCQMNVRDSEVISGLLTANRYSLTVNEDEADIILYNTCSVRQHAEDRVWSELGTYKLGVGSPEFGVKKLQTPNSKLQTKHPIIGVIGCMAQNYKDEIFRRAPVVDLVCGTKDIHKLPDMIKEATSFRLQATGKQIEVDSKFRCEDIYRTNYHEDRDHVYVVISEGCNNFCSYCIVPYVRGRLRNRKVKDIITEIKRHVDTGISKVTLLGQNVNSYSSFKLQASGSRLKRINFVDLLYMVSEIEGVKELSFITSHPKDIDTDLFYLIQERPNIKKYLHLPIQSGSDRILKLMNRRYTRRHYLGIIEQYRKIVKNGILSTDIILGFPSERLKDFKDTYNLVEELRFDSAYIFKYSPRPHTKALKLKDDVSLDEKKRRHQEILNLQKKISNEKKS